MQPLLDARGVEDLQTALRDYTVDGLHELVGFAGQLALARGELDALDRCLDDSPLGDLVRLFLLGQALLSSRAARALAPLDLARAEEGGLISQTSDVVIAGVDLRPYAEAEGPNWWVLSDFGSDVRPGPVAPSHVLGIGAASISLAQATVRSPVARSLDVGTGCGIQSLHLSRHSAAVTATDVSSRALRLAATTAALNGLDWDLRQGSLLEPVGADEYDLIVANPPFVLSPGAIHYDYRDGGLPGDELCRRLVSGLPARLRPGGTAQLLANWAIGPEQSWDERVSGWLDGSNCSAWIWQREVVEPSAYVTMWLRDSGETPASPTWNERYGRWLSWFESAGIVAIGMGLINIRAHARAGRLRGRPAGGRSAVRTGHSRLVRPSDLAVGHRCRRTAGHPPADRRRCRAGERGATLRARLGSSRPVAAANERSALGDPDRRRHGEAPRRPHRRRAARRGGSGPCRRVRRRTRRLREAGSSGRPRSDRPRAAPPRVIRGLCAT